jgi:hypothetical protein
MKSRTKHFWMPLIALLFTLSVAHAQTEPAPAPAQPAPPAVQSNFTQPELDQMLAPIALYPDALLSQMLMAATYPNEVVAAANWSKANPGYKGEAAVKAVEGQQWDISVKSLLPFPNVLSTMATKIDWTNRLGLAFQGQEQQVMDTIQSLRQKAMQSGYLKSDNRIRVAVQDRLIVVEPVTPTAVYIPYYNPLIVYGTWWAPAYAPVYWAPWPGYAVAPGYYGWYWSPVATIVTAGLLFAAFDWHHRHSYIHHSHYGYWSGHRYGGRHYFAGRTSGTTRWTRDRAKPISRVSGTRTGIRTTTTRTGTRTTTTRTGTRTGARTGTRTVTKGTARTGTRSTTGTRSGARTGTVRSGATRGGAPTGGRTGGTARTGGGAPKSGGRKASH